MEGMTIGLEIVTGREPEMRAGVAFGGDLVARLMANGFNELPRDESKIEANDGVCWPTENQSLLLSSELGNKSSV